MLTISPDVTAHVSHDTKKRGQQQVHAVQGDIASPTTDADTATDDYSYQVVSLRFKEAREPKQPFGIGKTLTLQRAARRTQGAMRRCPRRCFAHTLSFADSSSLADRFLVDSAPPRGFHMRAPVNIDQASFAIFLVEEDLEDPQLVTNVASHL